MAIRAIIARKPNGNICLELTLDKPFMLNGSLSVDIIITQ